MRHAFAEFTKLGVQRFDFSSSRDSNRAMSCPYPTNRGEDDARERDTHHHDSNDFRGHDFSLARCKSTASLTTHARDTCGRDVERLLVPRRRAKSGHKSLRWRQVVSYTYNNILLYYSARLLARMQTVTLVAQKGGTGKTSLALALAVCAADAVQIAVILDIDPQATACNWHHRLRY